jgi:folate-binding protein YgfZ
MTLFELPERRILRAEGSERVEFLHGQLSSNVKALTAAGGQASLLLSAQGRVEAIVALYDTGETIEIACDAREIEAVRERLERFLIADDVELITEDAPVATFALYGPDAPAELAALSALQLGHGWQRSEATIGGTAVTVRARGEFLHPFFEISTSEPADGLRRSLVDAAGSPAGADALARIHVESGVARSGVDVDESRVALEARLQWAIHFAKGCYVGQEVVERMVSRGRLNRRLALLSSDSPLEVGARIDDGAEVEVVTSSVLSPEHGALALAYVDMVRTNPGTSLSAGGTPARVLEWPMREVYAGRKA